MKRKLVIVGICCAVLLGSFGAHLLTAAALLWSDSGWVRGLGRAGLRMRVRLGMAGPGVLVDAFRAGTQRRDMDVWDRPTLEIIHDGYALLAQAQKEEFIRRMKQEFLQARHRLHSDAIAIKWGKAFDVEFMKTALVSKNLQARASAMLLIWGYEDSLGLADRAYLLNAGLEAGLSTNDDHLLGETFGLASSWGRLDFLERHRETITALLRSRLPNVRRLAGVLLARELATGRTAGSSTSPASATAPSTSSPARPGPPPTTPMAPPRRPRPTTSTATPSSP